MNLQALLKTVFYRLGYSIKRVRPRRSMAARVEDLPVSFLADKWMLRKTA